jgi:hypothetical protein
MVLPTWSPLSAPVFLEGLLELRDRLAPWTVLPRQQWPGQVAFAAGVQATVGWVMGASGPVYRDLPMADLESVIAVGVRAGLDQIRAVGTDAELIYAGVGEAVEWLTGRTTAVRYPNPS